ncbi:hypothetical protein [Streptomyces sp. NPDC127072]|uniref:hypothetical protein n=1 Tax=Streptomyces sp. NPDC127072 TaxID=3347129 RepID=UPI00365C5C0D
MTTHVTEADRDPRPGAGRARDRERDGERGRGRGAAVRALLFVTTALVAGGAGVGGTLLQQRLTAPDTSAVDAQAAELSEDLRTDLTAGFHSGGKTYGGQFTGGTIAAQVLEHGGALLSADTVPGGSPGASVHTVKVMLGLVPPAAKTVDPAAYPVRCYRYTFGLGAYTVKRSAMDCPDSRTDDSAGSLAAELGVLLARLPTGSQAYRAVAADGYAHTPRGATDFLRDRGLLADGDTVTEVSGEAMGADVYVLALRINDACHYLRMDSSASASSLVPLWAAPADEQQACVVRQAATAATLYGMDPAKAG